MTGNRSLDEFAGASGGGEDDRPADDGTAADPVADPDPGNDANASDADEATGADGDVVGADPEETAAEPPASTYAWSPDGGECAVCGAAVEERWRDGDAMVCLDCKEW